MSSSANRCRDDLLARRRRGPLSAVEQRALDAHLGVCELCRASHAFGALYDGIPDLARTEDDVLVARLADRIAGRAPIGGRRRRTKAIAVAAALALLVAAGGAAAWISTRRPPTWSLEGQRGAPAERPRPSVASRTVVDLAPDGEALTRAAPRGNEPQQEAKPEAAKTTARRRAPAKRAQTAASATVPPTAAELFAAANAARRALDLRGAVDLYQALERRFPDSEEASVALVSRGDLLSRLGEPEGALRSFDRYLARRPNGSLAPEALFGRARSLQTLGRRDDEIGTWRRLLRAFPRSIYEPAGRVRLDELLR